jgi:hypothetical protein
MSSAHIDPSFSCAVRRQLLEPRCASAGRGQQGGPTDAGIRGRGRDDRRRGRKDQPGTVPDLHAGFLPSARPGTGTPAT